MKEYATVDEAAERIGVSKCYIRELLNRAQIDKTIKLRGSKCGKEWRIVLKSIDEYLGIERSEEDYKKDLRIKELEGQIKTYEVQIQSFKALATTLQSLIGG